MNAIIVPIVVSLLIMASFGVVMSAVLKNGDVRGMDIIIDADKAGECLEGMVIKAKNAAGGELSGAGVYIRGGNEKEVLMLCRAYEVERENGEIEWQKHKAE